MKSLKEYTIGLCEDELNYHVNKSGCADEYHGDICVEIELLYRLGAEDSATSYKEQYLDFITKKGIEGLKKDFNKFWDTLVA